MQSKVREGSPGGRSRTTGIGFVKQVGFKPGVKERGLWMSSGKTEEEKVIGEVMGESELEELVPE